MSWVPKTGGLPSSGCLRRMVGTGYPERVGPARRAMVLRELPIGSGETPRRGRISILSGSGLTVSESDISGNTSL